VARPGFHGVELFFVISGFILALPFASAHLRSGPPVPLGKYFLRRLTRLEPPYILCMVFLFVMLVSAGRGARALWPHLLASLTYVHNLVYAKESLINNVAWSLEVEIQFYLLVPLLALVFAVRSRLRRRMIIVGVGLLSLGAHILYVREDPRLSLTILNYLYFFLIGFLLADIYLVEWNRTRAGRLRWDLVSLVGWPVLFAIWNTPALATWARGVVPEVFFPVCTFVLYCAVFRGVITNRLFTNPWITVIGGMCYTIYLLHNYAIGWLVRFTKDLAPASYDVNLLIQGALVLPLLLIGCAVYFVLIEQPCMRPDWPIRFRKYLSGLLRARAPEGAAKDRSPASRPDGVPEAPA
ncbi:MAG TPA: acyltransferase, partial [Thermoanaerobaculia bacterium]|nr:acyltransferase [Thermoanaerobaculia bacterium]